MNRPNIILFHSHDTGRYIQPYGHAIPTPNLQRLAEQGVLFRQAFCAAPTCSPSRASLLTGQWAHCTGMLGLAHVGFSLNDYSRHLVHTLRRAGYHTALAGLQHIDGPSSDPALYAQRIGYDVVLGREKMTGRFDRSATVPQAVEYIRQAKDRPFFLDVGFSETHRPFPRPGPGDDARYTLPPAPLPDTIQTRQDMAGFKTAARTLDEKIGVVLAALEEAGLTDKTLIIYTTDHGMASPGMKCNLTDHGLGVSLILRGPQQPHSPFAGGKVCDAMVSQIDLFPTLCDFLEIEPPAWLQGVSMMPLARGEATQVRDELFGEVTFHAAYEPQRCVRTTRWKYIRRFDDWARPVLPNCDDGYSKAMWVAAGWPEREQPREALYDLTFDPNEAHNAVNDPACAAALTEIRARLHRWMRQTSDPLLNGPVRAPEGTKHNRQDQFSPDEPTFNPDGSGPVYRH